MSHDPIRYTMFGAEFSYYAGKTRSYLLHTRIPFVEQPVTAWTYFVTMRRRVGAAVVPVLLTPKGDWLQDSSVIMDVLEARFPQAPALHDQFGWGSIHFAGVMTLALRNHIIPEMAACPSCFRLSPRNNSCPYRSF